MPSDPFLNHFTCSLAGVAGPDRVSTPPPDTNEPITFERAEPPDLQWWCSVDEPGDTMPPWTPVPQGHPHATYKVLRDGVWAGFMTCEDERHAAEVVRMVRSCFYVSSLTQD